MWELCDTAFHVFATIGIVYSLSSLYKRPKLQHPQNGNKNKKERTCVYQYIGGLFPNPFLRLNTEYHRKKLTKADFPQANNVEKLTTVGNTPILTVEPRDDSIPPFFKTRFGKCIVYAVQLIKYRQVSPIEIDIEVPYTNTNRAVRKVKEQQGKQFWGVDVTPNSDLGGFGKAWKGLKMIGNINKEKSAVDVENAWEDLWMDMSR